jgi:predicted nuclease of restriction endonuclease-like (RecB) superfamily
VNDEVARSWYEKEAYEQTWSVRTLQRNIVRDSYKFKRKESDRLLEVIALKYYLITKRGAARFPIKANNL